MYREITDKPKTSTLILGQKVKIKSHVTFKYNTEGMKVIVREIPKTIQIEGFITRRTKRAEGLYRYKAFYKQRTERVVWHRIYLFSYSLTEDPLLIMEEDIDTESNGYSSNGHS